MFYNAIIKNHKSVVREMIRKGFDVNGIDGSNSFKMTPLHYAVRVGNFRLADFLIKRGACVNAKNSQGDIPLQLCLKYSQISLSPLIVKNVIAEKDLIIGNVPFYVDVDFCYDKTVKLLFDISDLNSKNDNGSNSNDLIKKTLLR